MDRTREVAGASGCGCAQAATGGEVESQPVVAEPNLENLIPIALVIAAGCESCAEKMVARALEQGSPRRHVQKTLQVIAKMQKLDCFAQAVGPEAVARMRKPLAAGQRFLHEAITSGRR